jgi:hypothetical protein
MPLAAAASSYQGDDEEDGGDGNDDKDVKKDQIQGGLYPEAEKEIIKKEELKA